MAALRREGMSAGPDGRTDVLVIGGGPAAAWAAIAAAEAGAGVTLVDKGYHGTSGATAPSNTGTWCVPPGEHRAQAVARRWERTMGLADQRWMLRLVDRCYENLQRLVEWGYPFPTEESGLLYTANLRGPDYMRFMRARVLRAGVRVLRPPSGDRAALRRRDHHRRRRAGARDRRGTGGSRPAPPCSRPAAAPSSSASSAAPGLTGDGLLMAAEAGASLSGMEFTGKYTLAPYDTSLNKGLPFRWATFYDAAGAPLCDAAGEPVANGIGPAEKDVARRAHRGAGPCPARPGRAGVAGLAAPGSAELLPALRPSRHRSVPRPLPRHAPRRGHGARHRRHPRHQLGMHDRGARASTPPATRPPARTWRARPRAAARSTRPGRCRAAGGPAGAPPASHAGAARPAAFRAVSRRLGTAGLRPTERPRAIDPREVIGGGPRRGHPARQELLPRRRAARGEPRADRDALARGAGASRRRGRRAASRPRGRRGHRRRPLVARRRARPHREPRHAPPPDLPGATTRSGSACWSAGSTRSRSARPARPPSREERAS